MRQRGLINDSYPGIYLEYPIRFIDENVAENVGESNAHLAVLEILSLICTTGIILVGFKYF